MADIQQLSEQIAEILKKTFTSEKSIRGTSEEELKALETTSNLYGLSTLYLSSRNEFSLEVRISAAIAFKNFIKKNWSYDPTDESSDQVDRIEAKQRDLIKENITKIMLDSPSLIQRQLSEAITIIGRNDFPHRWPNLIVELQTYIKSDNFNIIHGVLQTAHSIFRHYRYELQSDRLWSEIKLVIEHFAQPFTDKFKQLMTVFKTVPQTETAKLEPIYQSLLLCTKIYHSLITQDLPEFFEDRLNEWLLSFLELLNVQNTSLADSTRVIEEMKSEICEIASLFVQRYSDADNFKEYAQQFAQNIWNLLITTNDNVQTDTLVSSAIRYLVTVAERPESRALFQDATVLNLLCQRVIIPNLTFRETDEELFEDDPEEYLKRDIEGSDVDTRRRAACDLVQVLSKFLERELIQIFGGYIEEMLTSYGGDKSSNWRKKDLAIFLYSAMAIKGSTRQHGTVTISSHVNVEKFLQEKVVDELYSDSTQLSSQILRADALRYITTFRNHISLNTLVTILPSIVKHITSNNVVVRTYASITLEKLLTMRDPTNPKTTAFKSEQFEPHLGELIKTLFDALELPGSPENEHIMKAIMRLFSFVKINHIVQFLPVVVPKLTNKLGVVARNPSKPYFNHYLFETLALTIRAACSQNDLNIRNQFESVLFSILEVVLNQDVQEFIPYVLQLLNLILMSQPTGSVSDGFIKLFQELLSPTLWERAANIRPLTELMHSYIEKMSHHIISQNKLIPLLGIFQKLIASKATDHEALALLQTMVIHLPASEIDAKMKDIFMLVFQRLTGSKTTKFVKHTLVCFSMYAYLRGANMLASVVNQLQDKIFAMVVEKLYIAEVKKITDPEERRICTCGMIKILDELPFIAYGAYNHLTSPMFHLLMDIFELPLEIVDDEDEHFADISDSLDFQAQYSKLNYACRKERYDPTKEVHDLKDLFVTSVKNLNTKIPDFLEKQRKSMPNHAVTNPIWPYLFISCGVQQ